MVHPLVVSPAHLAGSTSSVPPPAAGRPLCGPRCAAAPGVDRCHLGKTPRRTTGFSSEEFLGFSGSLTHDGSMVLSMVCHGSHQYTPFMLAYIPAPWIVMGHGFTQFHHEDLWIFTSSKRTKRFGCDSTHNDGDLSATQIQNKT